jgi:hypothetical protein
MKINNYDLDIVVQGFPGKSVCHGGLGWAQGFPVQFTEAARREDHGRNK